MSDVEESLTMRAAADALLHGLYEAVRVAEARSEWSEAAGLREQALHINEMAALVDPDDIFEQDVFRRGFINQLAELNAPNGQTS